jgi:hypothetical protein
VSRVVSLRRALIVTERVNRGEDDNSRTDVRAGLLIDLFGLPNDDIDSCYTAVTEVITSRISLEAGILMINAAARRLREIEERKKK